MKQNFGIISTSIFKMENSFYRCKSLQSIYISKINFENVTMKSLFYGCVSLVEIFISNIVVNNLNMNVCFMDVKH